MGRPEGGEGGGGSCGKKRKSIYELFVNSPCSSSLISVSRSGPHGQGNDYLNTEDVNICSKLNKSDDTLW